MHLAAFFARLHLPRVFWLFESRQFASAAATQTSKKAALTSRRLVNQHTRS